MNSKVKECDGCINSGTYMCTKTEECINQSLYVPGSKDYIIDIDNFTKIKCSINDKEPRMEVIGDYTTSTHHISGIVWTKIEVGELKGCIIDKSKSIQIVDAKEFNLSEYEYSYGLYSKSNIIAVYFNISTGLIGHKCYPR